MEGLICCHGGSEWLMRRKCCLGGHRRMRDEIGRICRGAHAELRTGKPGSAPDDRPDRC